MDPQKPSPTGERLSKRVAHLLSCSRSEAEHYIAGGWVQVDGVVIEEPQFRVLQQHVTIDPHASLLDLAPVSLVFHKPAKLHWEQAPQQLSKANHYRHDASGLRVLQCHFKQLRNLTPLETGASGLMLFSQAPRIIRKLCEDLALIEQELMATVAGEITPEALQPVRQALQQPTFRGLHSKVSVSSSGTDSSTLRFAIKGSHPGCIAAVCDHAQLQLQALRRIRLGRLALRDLPPGQWRYLEAHEII